MKIVKKFEWSAWMKHTGIGATALAVALTFSFPTAVAAKEKKSVSKVVLHKKASKKVAKKVSKPKVSAKHTKAVKQKTVSKKRQASVAKQRSRKAAKPSSDLVWKSSHKPNQSYYLMPTSFGGKVAKPQQQPDYLKPTATAEKPAAKSGKAHQVGTASYYSDKFDGQRTASGERFDQDNLTCAHGSLPFGCRIRVTNLRNNKAVDVKVNDRGGFSGNGGRVIDLSKAAAKEIGMMATGTAKVKVEVLE